MQAGKEVVAMTCADVDPGGAGLRAEVERVIGNRIADADRVHSEARWCRPLQLPRLEGLEKDFYPSFSTVPRA